MNEIEASFWFEWYYQNIVIPDMYPDEPHINDLTIYVCRADDIYWIKDETGCIFFLNV